MKSVAVYDSHLNVPSVAYPLVRQETLASSIPEDNTNLKVRRVIAPMETRPTFVVELVHQPNFLGGQHC